MVDLADVTQTMCNYAGCTEEFETCNDLGAVHVFVPVECAKGNFCCEEHRAQAMYEAQNENDRHMLRRYYLGAQLMVEYRRAATDIMKAWDVDDPYAEDQADAVACALSPQGGTLGKEGVEDDCEALLMPMAPSIISISSGDQPVSIMRW